MSSKYNETKLKHDNLNDTIELSWKIKTFQFKHKSRKEMTVRKLERENQEEALIEATSKQSHQGWTTRPTFISDITHHN